MIAEGQPNETIRSGLPRNSKQVEERPISERRKCYTNNNSMMTSENLDAEKVRTSIGMASSKDVRQQCIVASCHAGHRHKQRVKEERGKKNILSVSRKGHRLNFIPPSPVFSGRVIPVLFSAVSGRRSQCCILGPPISSRHPNPSALEL